MSAAIDKRPSVEDGIRNQFRGTCGGSGWRYLGWWERCKGCAGCQGKQR